MQPTLVHKHSKSECTSLLLPKTAFLIHRKCLIGQCSFTKLFNICWSSIWHLSKAQTVTTHEVRMSQIWLWMYPDKNWNYSNIKQEQDHNCKYLWQGNIDLDMKYVRLRGNVYTSWLKLLQKDEINSYHLIWSLSIHRSCRCFHWAMKYGVYTKWSIIITIFMMPWYGKD